MRVAVKVEKSLVETAKKLKIDVHELFRIALQDAVDALQREMHYERDSTHEQHIQEALNADLARLSDGQNDGNSSESIRDVSKRLKKATQSASGSRDP